MQRDHNIDILVVCCLQSFRQMTNSIPPEHPICQDRFQFTRTGQSGPATI